MRLESVFLLPALLLAIAGSAPAQRIDDGAATILAARAEAPAEERPAAPPAPRRAGGDLLFSMTGPDNAVCVRSVADVNGDGRDEIAAGIDESGTDNIFLLDGASSGTATVLWSIETVDGVSGGSPWGDQSLEPIGDPDGNGRANLLAGTAWGGRTAYNLDGLDGAIHWRFDTYLTADSGWVYSLAEGSDVTGDGVPEVAFGTGSDSDSVYLVDGASAGGAQAAVVWRYAAADAVLSVRSLGDVNGDGDADVVAAVGDLGDEVVCLDGGTADPDGHVLWTYPATGAFAVGVMDDLTGDGVDEALAVIWTSDGSAIRCLDGADGTLIWSSTDVGGSGMMVDLLADVTGDGVAEVVASSWENAVTVLDGADGSLVWKTPVDALNGGDVWSARAIDDLNGDGQPDVIAGSFNYQVYALDGVDGEILWSYDTGNRVFSVHPVGDLDGDGRPEVVAGTQDTTTSVVVYVLSGGAETPIFADGFESGDTAAWSSTVP